MPGETTTAIQCFNPCESADRMSAIERLGEIIAKSTMLGCDNKEQGMLIAATCAMEGLTPLDWKRKYHIVNGNVAMRSDRMGAEFRGRGGKYKILQLDRETCEVEFTFEKQKLSVKITMDDAKKAGWALAKKGVLKDNWKRTPDDMLFARVISKGVRRLCPEAVAGIYTPEEVADFVEVRTSEPPAPKTPPMTAEKATKTITETAPPSKVEPAEDIEDAEIVETSDEEEGQAGIDILLCPVVGKAFGKPWGEFSTDALHAILTSTQDRVTKAMTNDHRNEVKSEIARREVAGE